MASSSSEEETGSERNYEMNDDDSSTSSTSEEESLNEKLRTFQDESAKKLSKLAQHATSKLNDYSDDANTEFSKDPLKVYDEMATFTEDMKQVWKEYNANAASIEKEREIQEEANDSKFREAYLNIATEAFSDELDDLRQGRIRGNSTGNDKKKELVPDILKQDNIVMPAEASVDDGNVDVEIMVEMLKSEGWSKEEKKLLLTELQTKHTSDMDVDALTIHERRRMEIFGTK